MGVQNYKNKSIQTGNFMQFDYIIHSVIFNSVQFIKQMFKTV
ncbi:hypothetical protein EVA_16401 [gut metagenome]|uniref:Uncharacterized protein n=1 Tax=gut metagenome TaxID=749906 RepID=J9FM44_9ZZZZ